MYQKRVRVDGTAAIEEYLRLRIHSGLMWPMPDVVVAAGVILEMCKAFAAPPGTQVIAGRARETVAAVLENAFLISLEGVVASD